VSSDASAVKRDRAHLTAATAAGACTDMDGRMNLQREAQLIKAVDALQAS
jgi:hypothetical protein